MESQRKFEVDRNELKRLVWEMPVRDVAKMFSVSDSAILKRCRRLGIKTPNRGYWAKVKAGKIENQKEVNPLIPCACGCGILITKWGNDGKRKPRKCVPGHNIDGLATYRPKNTAAKLERLVSELKELT